MWGMKDKTRAECERICDTLEASASPETRGGIAASGTFLARFPQEVREHVFSCEACRTFAEELVEAREILGVMENKAEPNPFFLARVMASIASREAELESKAQTWAAVPRLAPRIALLASLGLLIAATWVYQMPNTANGPGWNSQQWAGLVDTSAVDDLLVSAASN